MSQPSIFSVGKAKVLRWSPSKIGWAIASAVNPPSSEAASPVPHHPASRAPTRPPPARSPAGNPDPAERPDPPGVEEPAASLPAPRPR